MIEILTLKLYLDIDKIERSNARLINKIINSSSQFFETDNISYTYYQKSDNTNSYHITLNDYYNSVKNQKNLIKQFIKCCPKFEKYIDMSIH